MMMEHIMETMDFPGSEEGAENLVTIAAFPLRMPPVSLESLLSILTFLLPRTRLPVAGQLSSQQILWFLPPGVCLCRPYQTQAQPAVGSTSAAPAQTEGKIRQKEAIRAATAATAAKDWDPPPDRPLQANGLPVASSRDTGPAPAGSQRPSPRLERPRLGRARRRRRIGRMLPAGRSCRLKLGGGGWKLPPHPHWQRGGSLAP